MNSINPNRVVSIDILRALTMTLMVFVNDLWSLTSIPGWLEHTAAAADGMGLADTVFPAFLFLTGMSVPLAINYRRSKGDNNQKIIFHIIFRSAALLVMGLFLVNGEYINEAATGMKRVVWNSICCTCFILVWNAWPAKANKWMVWSLKAIAIIVLFFLAWIYRGSGGEDVSGFTTWWWGILGLIGWAYFVSAVIFTLAGKNFIAITVAWLFFIFLCIASHAGWLPADGLLRTLISPLGDGSMPAFVTGGVLTTMIFLYFRRSNENKKIFILLFLLALLLLITGFYTRTFWGISKIRATPAWVLICSGITIIVFIIVYWLSDLKSKSNWFNIIKPAGTNTLLCYLLPYYAYAVVVLLQLSLPEMLLTGYIGLVKSIIFSLLIVMSAGWMGKAGIKLKL
jgi:heparan-alpha-glucosaminide N-acetyltransferase